MISDARCRDSYGQSDVADSMICAEGAVCLFYYINIFFYYEITIKGAKGNGWPDLCQGDSGGQVMILEKSI